MSLSLLWHDFETFGRDPRRDRPAQIASLRTNLDLQPISDPVILYCQPAADALPDPDACLLTGIGPSRCTAEGLSEAAFARHVHAMMAVPGTCSVGYNSLMFDDEVTRHLFWRNFLPPYDREWRSGNSRWDLINILRLAHAIRPEGLSWPQRDGVTSFRLQDLSEANDIAHEDAHDALADVQATLALARKLSTAQPRLFWHMFELRTKSAMREQIRRLQDQPCFHVSSRIPAQKGCCALIGILGAVPGQHDRFAVLDLRQDPRELEPLSDDQLQERIFNSNEVLRERALPRLPLKTLALNRCPVLLPAAILKPVSKAQLSRWSLDPEQALERWQWLQGKPDLRARLCRLLAFEVQNAADVDADAALYSGFISDADQKLAATVHERPPEQLHAIQFQDARLQTLLFRFRGRNFPETLDDEALIQWQAYCVARLNGQIDDQVMTYARFFASLEAHMAKADSSQTDLLQELQVFGESLAY